MIRSLLILLRRISLSGFAPRIFVALIAKIATPLFRTVNSPIRLRVNQVGEMELYPQEFIDQKIIVYDVWEPALTKFIGQHLSENDVAIDVGANIGYDTLLMAKCVGPKGKVFAIEPSPQIGSRLRRNIELNGLKNVEIIPCGISDRVEIRSFTTVPTHLGASHFGGLSEDGLCLRPLEEAVGSDTLRRASMIKIDVEGMEEPILRQLAKSMPALKPGVIIICEIRINDEILSTLKQFQSLNCEILEIPNAYSNSFYASKSSWVFPEFQFPKSGQVDVAIIAPDIRLAAS